MSLHIILAPFLLVLTAIPALAVDGPRMHLQKWSTRSAIYWVRGLTPDRVAISYGNGGFNGFDIIDSSGSLVRRVWPLPEGTACAAVYPDGRPFLRKTVFPAGVGIRGLALPDGRVLVLAEDGSSLLTLDSPTSAPRPFAWNAFHSTRPSFLGGFDVQVDGKVIAWGDLVMANGSLARVCRLEPDGTRDDGFRPEILDYVVRLRLAMDGAILVESAQDTSRGLRREWIWLNPDGTPRSSLSKTFPNTSTEWEWPTWPEWPSGIYDAAAMLDDGSVVHVQSGGQKLIRIWPDGSFNRLEGIGYWTENWGVDEILPLAGGRFALLRRANCLGGGCISQSWVHVVSGAANGFPAIAWAPPVPDDSATPMLFAEGLLADADYELEISSDLAHWALPRIMFGESLERSPDKTALFFRDFDAASGNPDRRFYRLRVRE